MLWFYDLKTLKHLFFALISGLYVSFKRIHCFPGRYISITVKRFSSELNNVPKFIKFYFNVRYHVIKVYVLNLMGYDVNNMQ